MTVGRLEILHVEDDPDIRLIAAMSLALDPRMAVRSVGSGGAALAMLDEGAWQPDLLLMDRMMPDVDGIELVGQIRSIDRLAAVPVVFLTARGQPGDLDQYRIAGSLGLIVKPFDPLTLAAKLWALLPTG